ncbi:hypothetical protein AB0L70_06925 [Kribbella sp. NPDC051952]|uniref:hypothetical protein n=1 Tax=Kribbella sp. NPDC051952 TaxID=3154851 RepID=UPI003436B0C1
MADAGLPAPYRLGYLPTGLVLASVARTAGTSGANRRTAATDHFAVYRTERDQSALTIAFESPGHRPGTEPDAQVNGLPVWYADTERQLSVIIAGDEFLLVITANACGPSAEEIRSIADGLEFPG